MYSSITKKTFNLIFEKRNALMKALLIPFIFLAIIEYFLTPVMKEELGSFNFFILIGASFIITLIMSILVHRILLLDESQTPTWGLYKPGGREVDFILRAIGIGIIVVVVAVGSSLILGIISTIIGDSFGKFFSILIPIVVLVFIGIIFSRLSLVFPATAIDKSMDLNDAFTISQNYKLLTFIMIIIVPSLLALLLGFAYGIVIEFLMGVISQKLSVLYSLLNIFITVFTIGFLSVTYEYIMSKEDARLENLENDISANKPIFEKTKLGFNIIIDDKNNISFEDIKEQLKEQYFSLGFTNIVLDKEASWMAKNQENEKSYILLSYSNNEYRVETYNIEQKPELNIQSI